MKTKKMKGQSFVEYALIICLVGLAFFAGSMNTHEATKVNFYRGLLATNKPRIELPESPDGIQNNNESIVAIINGPDYLHIGARGIYTDASTCSNCTIVRTSWGQPQTSKTYTFNKEGTETIELTVFTKDGFSKTVQKTITVGNQKPTPKIEFQPNQTSYKRKQEITISGANSSDPDGDSIIKYEWYVDGTLLNISTNSFKNKFNPGTHNIKLVVYDNFGLKGEITRQLKVDTNALPNALITISPNKTTFLWNEAISVSGNGSYDADNDFITGSWKIDGISRPFNLSGGIITPLPQGNHNIQLTVTDEYGDSNTVSLNITVRANSKPIATINMAPTTNIKDNTSVTFNSNGSYDPDGDAITKYEWVTDNGVAKSTPPTQVFTKGSHTVKVRAYAGGLWSDWASKTFEVIASYEPYSATYTYSGRTETWTAPYTGVYQIELWGAQGGNAQDANYTGGLGGYVKGNISLNQGDILYLSVGGMGGSVYKGIDGDNQIHGYGGFNGGGNGVGTRGPGGGGGTDIRINGTSTANKILVAGGGGGGGSSLSPWGEGGHMSSPYTYQLHEGRPGRPNYWTRNDYPSDQGGGGGGYYGGSGLDGDDPSTAYGGTSYINTDYFTSTFSSYGVKGGHGQISINRLKTE